MRVEVGAEEVALGRAAGQHRHHVPQVQARARRRHLLFIPGRNQGGANEHFTMRLTEIRT